MTLDELERWLAEHDDFVDGRLAEAALDRTGPTCGVRWLVAAEAGSVCTGNCVLTPEEWLRHVDTGELPPAVVTGPPE